jgi:hypothetical protein
MGSDGREETGSCYQKGDKEEGECEGACIVVRQDYGIYVSIEARVTHQISASACFNDIELTVAISIAGTERLIIAIVMFSSSFYHHSTSPITSPASNDPCLIIINCPYTLL